MVRVPEQIADKVLEGSGAGKLMRFRRVAGQIADEVLEGSGTHSRQISGGFRYKNIPRSSKLLGITHATFITNLVYNYRPEEALGHLVILSAQLSGHIFVDSFCYAVVLSTCQRAQQWKLVNSLSQASVQAAIQPNIVSFTTVVRAQKWRLAVYSNLCMLQLQHVGSWQSLCFPVPPFKGKVCYCMLEIRFLFDGCCHCVHSELRYQFGKRCRSVHIDRI